MNCPKCDAPMEREAAEPDVGILVGGWACTACEEFVPDWDTDDDFHDMERRP